MWKESRRRRDTYARRHKKKVIFESRNSWKMRAGGVWKNKTEKMIITADYVEHVININSDLWNTEISFVNNERLRTRCNRSWPFKTIAVSIISVGGSSRRNFSSPLVREPLRSHWCEGKTRLRMKLYATLLNLLILPYYI
jgi:hypothetical protein